ncbi:MAG: heme lyase CcmF/NrfE family subunit [Anaerolineae bacterium]|nr:heme lyase CcmF/NrfE family subunit [Anaerolineae bacterium]
MNAVLGALLLYVALACTLYSTIAASVGAYRKHTALVESARNAAIAAWLLATLSMVVLIVLLIQGDFGVAYVWSVTQRSMPIHLKVTALWGGQSGSLLFWSWLLGSFPTAAMLHNRQRARTLVPVVIAVSMGTLAFFLLLAAFWENPFARWWTMPNGEIIQALFAPSPILSGLSSSISNLADHAPGLLGIVFDDMVVLAPPAGSLLFIPPDGQGLNPLLRHLGMVIHPPMLYLGFVGFVVPYAFGFAALSVGDGGDAWIWVTRRWTLVAWLFLSAGLLLGSRWAYDVLGWGGYWGWDPVENSALMPWLTGTAFLHSVMLQERYGMMRRWNMVLIIATYLLIIVGTFLARSGGLSSVHAFAQIAIGPLFFMFWLVATIASASLLMKRWDALRSGRSLDSLFSRGMLLLINNFIFVVIAVAVAVGTFWPTITEVLSGFIPIIEKSSVGPGYYNRVTGPMFLSMLLLMGIVPLVGWGHVRIRRLGRAILWPLGGTLASMLVLFVVDWALDETIEVGWGAAMGYGLSIFTALVTILEFHRGAVSCTRTQTGNYLRALWVLVGRNRRRYGGYCVHIGVVIMAIGVISSHSFQQETQQTIAVGQTITLGSYELKYENLERFSSTDGRRVARVRAIVYRNGREVARLAPRIDYYPNDERMTIPATHTTLAGDDYYVLLVAWEQVDLSAATIKIYINPLVNWVWGGGVLLIVGTMVAVWPVFRKEYRASGASTQIVSQSLDR